MISSGILKLALKEAESSQCYPYRIGAVIFKGSRILSSGVNSIRSSSIPNKYLRAENSLHAEQEALLNLDWTKLKGCSILIVRLGKKGSIRMAKPCPFCLKTLYHVGIKNIYHTTREGGIELMKTIDAINELNDGLYDYPNKEKF